MTIIDFGSPDLAGEEAKELTLGYPKMSSNSFFGKNTPKTDPVLAVTGGMERAHAAFEKLKEEHPEMFYPTSIPKDIIFRPQHPIDNARVEAEARARACPRHRETFRTCVYDGTPCSCRQVAEQLGRET